MRFLLLFICICYISCKKNDAQSGQSSLVSDEPCIVPMSVEDADTVAGQYIIAYTPGTVQPGVTIHSLSEKAETVLQNVW